jgi:hypothetical protein
MKGAGRPNVDDLVDHSMTAVSGARIDSVGVIYTPTHRVLLNHTYAHSGLLLIPVRVYEIGCKSSPKSQDPRERKTGRKWRTETNDTRCKRIRQTSNQV